MKWIKRIVLALAVLFLLMQFYRPARENPGVHPRNAVQAPPQVRAILERACNDCHSNQTDWPWYSNVAPVSWVLVDHVREGRHQLNFSEFATYSASRRQKAFDEICGEVKRRSMPLGDYVRLHPEARLSAEDVTTLCAWARSFAPAQDVALGVRDLRAAVE